MELADTVITPVVDSLIGVFKRHLGFYFSATKNVRDMHDRINQLNSTAREIETRKEGNEANNLAVPHRVPEWLALVEKIRQEAGNIPTGVIGCFNMKMRYKAGKRSFDILQKIEDLEKEVLQIRWTDEKWPLGRVRSTMPSTFEQNDDDVGTQNRIIKSRDLIFEKALKSLDPNNKIQKIALCGMGGVGKTTMMKQLKMAAENRKMFDWVVEVVIGKSEKLISIQETVAEYIGEPLTETQKDTRAERLRNKFLGMSQGGKKKILVILDDLWDEIDLKYIGLTSPLPNGFKLLLTSRNESVCTKLGVKSGCIFRIEVLEEAETKLLFWEIAGMISDDDIDHDLHKIGEDIVKICGGLPIAIKTIASNLRDNNKKFVWEDTLIRLQCKNYFNLNDIFEISYHSLKDDDEKATFLLSGLFPDDYDIPIEDLLRYGWGLKLFRNAKTISLARRRVNTCVYNLIRSNLLIESDSEGCVKMHDLVRDFVLNNFSNVKQASLVNCDDISEKLFTEESYDRILLKCTGMREFPADLNHPKLELLKLLDGDELHMFSEDFFIKMEKLEVLSFDKIRQPLLPRYPTTLRTLCLSSCSSMGDISFIGDLINLEVLSFASCRILKLPSAIGNLKNLKLLDLTECVDLCIDDGVFQSLDKLIELYMRPNHIFPTQFTKDSCEGLNMLSSKLVALEIEFFDNILQPKNFPFKKFERFMISIGCHFGYIRNGQAYKNTLRLFVSCKELLECKIYELFGVTEELDLRVSEMTSFEDISIHPSQCSFGNLRDLRVHNCADLTCIFTASVVNSLLKLEKLRVSECPVLEYLVQCENSGTKVIKFHKLKFLHLNGLPMFVSLCDTDQVIMELPQLVTLIPDRLPKFTSIVSKNNGEISTERQPLVSKKIVIPNLEVLRIWGMRKLQEICSCENTNFTEEDVKSISMLKWIQVMDCHGLVNLFPCHPMRLLSHLTIINDQNQQQLSLFHNLTRINLIRCKSIKYLFSTVMATHLSNLKIVKIRSCESMEEVISNRDDDEDEHTTPPTITTLFPQLDSLTLVSLSSLKHADGGVSNGPENDIIDQPKYSQVAVVCWTLCQYSRVIDISYCPALSHVIPSHVAGQILMVERLYVRNCIVMREVFETTYINNSGGLNTDFDERSGGTNTASAIPRLRSIITAFKLLNLETIDISDCHSLEYIFTFSTLRSLTKLKEINIARCKAMKFIVKEENGEQTVVTKEVIFPHLQTIRLDYLPNLEGFFLGMSDFKWPSLDNVEIDNCPKMMAFTSGKSTAPKLKCIHSRFGTYRPECHNIHVTTNSNQTSSPSLENSHLSLHDAIEVNVEGNDRTTEVFAFNQLLQLPNLEKIHVKGCFHLTTVFEVVALGVVTDNEINSKSQTVVTFPKLREVELDDLFNLRHLWKSKQGIILEFPNLTRLSINRCHHLMYVLTSSMVGSLVTLQELSITYNWHMNVIVVEEEEEEEGDYEEECVGDAEVSEMIILPCLKSLTLERLYRLKGFYLGKEVDVSLPTLNTLVIKQCPELETFCKGRVTAPELKAIETNCGRMDLREQDINSFIFNKKQEGLHFEMLRD